MGSFNEELCLCNWRFRKKRADIDNRLRNGLNAQYEEGESPVIHKSKQQLAEYFDGQRKSFDIPLLKVGTSFQQSVWDQILKIPYGKTWSYYLISQKIGNTSAIRAVASANGANAIAIIIPCHRVVGSSGELTGYAGGIAIKRRLLQLETKDQSPAQSELFS